MFIKLYFRSTITNIFFIVNVAWFSNLVENKLTLKKISNYTRNDVKKNFVQLLSMFSFLSHH